MTDKSDAGSVGIFSRRARRPGYVLSLRSELAGIVRREWPNTRNEAKRRRLLGTNQTQDAQVYSHDGPIGRGTRRYILTTGQSDAGRASIFSRRTNRTHESQVKNGAALQQTYTSQHFCLFSPSACARRMPWRGSARE
eukprot:741566-Prorocentrum_minimum.AAC.1